MSNVKINGTTYTDVNKIKLPLSSNESEYAVFDKASGSIVDGSFSGEYENNEITSVRANAFNGMSGITSFKSNTVTAINTYCFQNCKGLTSIELPKLERAGAASFSGCSALEELVFPKLSNIDLQAFSNCTSLKKFDMLGAPSTSMIKINIQTFSGCSALETFIIRSTSTITGLNGDNAFANTPIASGTGYIYVPNALLETYKAETSWATYKNQLRAIEDYPDICG